MGTTVPTRQVVEAVAVDFEEWDAEVAPGDPLGFVDTVPYAERVERARRATGLEESVLTGVGRVDGHDVALVAGAFEFMAGTLGVASAERVVRAFDRATARRLPVLAMTASGGTRMQEGVLGFVQMIHCAAAVRRHREAGLPYVAYLRHPTTGGVLASFGSLAHVTLAEPGALLAMTGPRVARALSGTSLPPDVQRAEHLHEHGLVDGIVALDDLAERVGQVLAVTSVPASPWVVGAPPLDLPDDVEVDGWEAIERSRRTSRPGIRQLLAACAADVTELRGDGAGSDDAGCLVALARVCGVPAVVVGHDRPEGARGARLGAAGHRKARRGMELAAALRLPLVTVIDTAGAEISTEAEEGGLAREIARCIMTMTGLDAPTLSVLLGEGSGGGALALLPADRVIAAEHAWLAPLAPEGASEILYRTPDRAADLATAQAVSSTDLRRLGIVDAVVPDRPPPGEEGDRFTERIAATAARELGTLLALDNGERRRARARRYRPLPGPDVTAPRPAPGGG